MSRKARRLTAAAGTLLVTAAVFLGAITPTSAQTFGGNVAVSWSIPNAPAAGLTNISFPITVHPETSHTAGTYFAQQFDFLNGNQGAYTGLQPRPSINGRERLRGVFSTFQSGSTTNDPNCYQGADGGPGVSCGYEFDAVYGRTYNMVLQRTSGTTWTGAAVDTTTNQSTHIGSWTLPASNGNIKPSQGGFVEYYDTPGGCSQLPRVNVTFDGPTSTGTSTGGTTRAQYEYGECTGQANYQSAMTGSGVNITRGWGGTAGKSVRNTAAGRCLDIPASNTANGTELDIWDCHGGPNQAWATSSAKTLTALNKCLDTGNSSASGSNAVVWDCHGGATQQWNVQSDGTIRSVQTGLCLAMQGTATANGTKVVQSACGGQSNQQWTIG
ncbi:RICIN domain-containing protein [Streptomyces sp. NPDC005706]|uniref:RICIN domain-containing protein n=1 Tax=Streptomyces sp. NPDC005706 TaxID=3157169 RepID=UPI0033EE5641